MTRATAPIDLLREFRAGFEAEVEHWRSREKDMGPLENRIAIRSKAYAAEQAVKKIDATLRDWA